MKALPQARPAIARAGYRCEPYHRAPSRARLRPQSALLARARRHAGPVRRPLSRSRLLPGTTGRRTVPALQI